MPKIVDHLARRTQIADALLSVAAGQGLEAVSLRHVAAEAGVSTGMVQHYFRTKDEMMGFALEVVSERVERRMAEKFGADTTDAPGLEQLRELFLQMLPLDAARMDEGKVALAFLAYAAVKPEMAEGIRRGTAQLQEYLAELLRQHWAGRRHSRDPELSAIGTLALVEGLGLYLLNGHYSADQAVSALDQHLADLQGN